MPAGSSLVSGSRETLMNDEIAALIEGLSRPQKTISPKYFYDETGSQLFEKITCLRPP